MINNKLVSYCIFTYNQEAYIEEALKGAVNQTYTPLEIIVSDDASGDSTFEIIEKFKNEYAGEHTLIINRNPTNLGLGGHFSHVLYNIASGDYLTLLGGDDISKPGHVKKVVRYLEEDQEVCMVDCNGEIIDSKGVVLRRHQNLQFDRKRYYLEDYLKLRHISSFAPGRIFKRCVIENFDPISNNCPTEDSVLVLRSLMVGCLMRINEDLILYRRHDQNVSGSDNMRKISNLAIVSQYYKDVIKLYCDQKLDDLLVDALFKRIHFQYKFRTILYRGKNDKISKIFKKIRLKALRVLYK